VSIIKPIVTANFAEHVVEVLTPLLGPHTARRALAMICKRANKEAHELGPTDLAIAHTTLRPMLRTLIGNEVTVRVLADLGVDGGGAP
jgi:hypothetical protein